ncbi:MAG: 50S ribosomal protein L15 [Spirochaetia bacterium]|jgi:large subunit ribosomal protein L15|nr:50S ribosomal protein L15 [Spirochaetia bacterium]
MGQIKAPEGANKKKTIVGRGYGSKGRSSGRGHDGQKSRSGGGVRPGFEGGQMPLYRRLARKGFSNHPFKKEYQVVSLGEISNNFVDGDVVTLEALKAKRIVKGKDVMVKILADGDIDKKVIIEGLKVSGSAAVKVAAVGGEIK